MMDRERVEAELRQLEQWIDDPPPLLTLVILANGRGLAFPYPLLDVVGHGTLEQRRAALNLVRTFLRDFDNRLGEKLAEIVAAQGGL